MDAAFHLYYIIVTDDFAIQNHRFGAVVTQIFPLLGSRLGLSLNSILIIYSAGIAFYYAFCYYICGSVLKQYAFAILLLLFNTLIVTDTFFWMHSELPQGCALLIVVFALINNALQQDKPWLKYIIISALMIVTGFFHPLIFFPAVFLFLYFILKASNKKGRIVYSLFLLLYLIVYFIKFQFYKTPYDETATKYSDGIIHRLFDFFTLHSTTVFTGHLAGKFILIPILFSFAIAYYTYKKRWLKLILSSLFTVVYIALVNLSYHLPGTTAFYMENMYLPISIFLSVPIVFDALQNTISFKLPAIVLVFIIAAFVTRIFYIGRFYTGRLDWERDYLAKHGKEKLIIHERNVPMHTLLLSWGTCYEFWLLSTTEQGSTASLIISNNIEDLIPPPNKPKSFITPYNGFPYDILPDQYFIFKDTISEYRVIR